MDPTQQFFAKLKKLAKTLESETAKLQDTFENRSKGDDSEAAAKGLQVYHELCCDVGNTKGEILAHLAQQKEQADDVGKFIKACTVLEQKFSRDIQILKQQWEKYGYQAPGTTKLPTKPNVVEEVAEDEDETNSAEEGSREEDTGNDLSSPPKVEPPVADILKTPQPSDFGLSEIDLKRALAKARNCSDVTPLPVMSFPQPSLQTPALPMALTPKCALRMEDEELQTPQMRDFGISEHTMCLNNDFTMDLFRKNTENSHSRPLQDLPEPPLNSIMERLQTKVDTLESPEPPDLTTLDLKIKKTNSHHAPPAQNNNDPESPSRPDNLLATPDVPVFQTPFMNRLVSTNKCLKSAQQPEPVNITQADDEIFELTTPPHNGTGGSKCSWEYNVPDICGLGVEDMEIPEMPKLESVFGKSLQSRNAKNLSTGEHEELTTDPTVNILELDGPTQEFSLGTPRMRINYEEFRTPEMPDLSSVTQDICKLVSQAQLKTANTMKTHHIKAEKGRHSPPHRAVSLSLVSENEFQSLPSYLKQMTVNNLNKAVNNINKFIEEHRGELSELRMEELRNIISVGPKAPVFILCLTELKRLKHIGGVRNTSVYKLITHI